METFSLKEYLDEYLRVDIYPITIFKLLLNMEYITSFCSSLSLEKDNRNQIKVDHSNCEACGEKKELGILCRIHTSIDRVITAKKVLFDESTKFYLYKNEIFKMVDNKLVVFYCPHPTLIPGELTDRKVRKINTLVIEDEFKLPNYQHIVYFSSDDLLKKTTECWFNKEFSIVSVSSKRKQIDWCLFPNS